jgi:pilus assembly protein CpaE
LNRFANPTRQACFVGRTSQLRQTLSRVLGDCDIILLDGLQTDGKPAPAVLENSSVIFIEVLAEADDEVVLMIARGRGPSQRIIVLADQLEPHRLRRFIRFGISDLVARDASECDLQETLVVPVGTHPDGRDRNVFAFTPVLGGMGATTIAIEAALFLNRQQPNSTCVVDLDFYAGECADYLNIEAKLELDVLTRPPETVDEHLLNTVLSTHASGLKLLAAQTTLGAQKHVDSDTVLQFLDLICNRFANVMIDLPRAWSDWTDNIILGSDQLFLVSDSSVPAIRATKRQLGEYQQRYVGKIVPHIIINKFENSWLSRGLSQRNLAAAFSDRYAGAICDDTRLAREAIDLGEPISSLKRGARMIKDIHGIVQKYAK